MTLKELSGYPDNELIKYEVSLNDTLNKVCNKNMCASCTHKIMCDSWMIIYETLIERGYEALLKENYRRWLYVHIQHIKLTD